MHSYLITLLSLLFMSSALALDVKLTPEKDFVEVIHQGRLIKVQRIQDQDHVLEGGFAKTSRKCPPFCIQPMLADESVKTVAQLEVFDFMEKELLDETGLLVDARTPAWFKRGTIPGSVNIPFTVFSLDVDDPELIDLMNTLGVRRRGEVSGLTRTIEEFGLMGGDRKNDQWDFTNAKAVLIWCNGMWCGQAPTNIKSLLRIGYPPSKLKWYRGGMQDWETLGLTTITPE